MHATCETRPQDADFDDEPASEHSQVQLVVRPETISAQQLQYHLFVPRKTRDPVLDGAYELWRDVWQSTFLEADGVAELYSDEFTRQDEIGVLTLGTQCVAVTGLRWLDLARPMAREDSYFKHWPAAVLAALGDGTIGISSNAVVHPEWRGIRVVAPQGRSAEPVKLTYVAVGLTIQRFYESHADGSVAVTRNDRGMNRVCFSLGAQSRGTIELHGVEADLVHFPRNCIRKTHPALDQLWLRRRHQG
jgi:hypothetical protein